MIPGQTCATCRCYCAETGGAGQCRRRAPLPVLRADRNSEAINGYFDAFWPVVTDDEWCGDWAPHPQAQKKEGT